MRRRLATLAAMSALAFALSATPALASPVQHFTLLATQAGNAQDPNGPLVVTCGPHTYTATSGEFLIVTRDPSTAAHITAVNVWATDGLNSYRVVGAETYVDPAGRFTSKVMFVSQGGGIADSVNIVARYDKSGNLFVGLDLGTCAY